MTSSMMHTWLKKFQTANVQLLQKHGVQIHKIIEFTDQETIPTQRNFLGVRHGKDPCDACAG